MRKPGSASNSVAWHTLSLSDRVSSPREFQESVLQIRKAYTKVEDKALEEERYLHLMYYLLAWMVGDAGKNFHRNRRWVRFELDLSRKYPENLPLGNFVMDCISMLGVSCGRIADGQPRRRDSHGLYRWMSYFSEVFFWLHTACLGLRHNELTSYNPVRMRWLLTASAEARTWFLRGIADSDGSVNIRNGTVDITTEPNTELIEALLTSLGANARIFVSKGVGVVTLPARDAFRLRIFNPEVETKRGRLLEKIANARTFQRRWPKWLDEKVNRLLEEGLDSRTIRNRVLWENDTYVKLRSIQSRMKK